jgi:hypothetical protein
VLLDLVDRLAGGGEGAAKVEQELLKLAPASGPLGGVVSAISSVRTRYGVRALPVLVVWTACAPTDSCTSPTPLMAASHAGRAFPIRPRLIRRCLLQTIFFASTCRE